MLAVPFACVFDNTWLQYCYAVSESDARRRGSIANPACSINECNR